MARSSAYGRASVSGFRGVKITGCQKMRTAFFIGTIILITLVAGCSKSEKDRISAKISNLTEKRTRGQKTVSALPPDKLKNALPKEIEGTTRSPFRLGVISDESEISKASAEYVFPDESFLEISIEDYGNYDNIPKYLKKSFQKPPRASGKIVKAFEYKGVKGFVVFDEGDKSSTLKGLYLKRFLFRIDAVRVPVGIDGVEEYLRLCDFKALKNLLNKR